LLAALKGLEADAGEAGERRGQIGQARTGPVAFVKAAAAGHHVRDPPVVQLPAEALVVVSVPGEHRVGNAPGAREALLEQLASTTTFPSAEACASA
jgi:hypothetical protein